MINIETAAGEIGISAEAYRKLCSLFLSAMAEDLEGMKKALESGDREELAKRAHHIKGASTNLDFMDLSCKAEKIQLSAFKADSDFLQSEFVTLYAEYGSVKKALEAVL